MGYYGDIVGSADRAARRLEFSRTRTEDAEEEPVSLEEMRAHARIDDDFTEDDTMLEGLVAAARIHIENHTGRAFVEQTWEFRCDCFPAADGAMYLPRPPLISVETIAYIDENGDEQELVEDVDFVVDSKSHPARIAPAFGKSWPATRDQIHAVLVTAICGYGEAADVPETLKLAIKLLALHFYERPAETEYLAGGSLVRIPMGIQDLVASYRMRRLS